MHSVQGGTALPFPKEGFFGLSKPVAVFNSSEPSVCNSSSTVVLSERELAIYNGSGSDPTRQRPGSCGETNEDVPLEVVPEPAYFQSCIPGQCKGGPNFTCAEGYQGAQCYLCMPTQLLARGTCDTPCANLGSQPALVNALAIGGVVCLWLGMNKLTAGSYVPSLGVWPSGLRVCRTTMYRAGSTRWTSD